MTNAIQFYDNKILFGDSEGNNTDKIAFHEDCCCPGIQCTHCTTSRGPEEFQIVLAGFTGIDGGCGDCASIDGTYIVQYSDTCIWEYTLPSPICCLAKIVLYVIDVAGQKGVRVDLKSGTGSSFVTFFNNTYEGLVPCLSLDNEDIPYSTQGLSVCAQVDRCDGSSATCAVTALAV